MFFDALDGKLKHKKNTQNQKPIHRCSLEHSTQSENS